MTDKPEKQQKTKEPMDPTKKMLLVLMGMFGVLILLAAGQLFLLFNKTAGSNNSNNSNNSSSNSSAASASSANSSQKDKKQEVAKELLKNLQIVQLSPLTVNLADTDYKRYLRIQLSVAYSSDNAEVDKAKLKNYTPVFQAAAINVLRNKSYNDLDSVQKTKRLQQEILKALNSAVGEDFVKLVFITDFVVQ